MSDQLLITSYVFKMILLEEVKLFLIGFTGNEIIKASEF
tara:strand:- start:286 stop:402 length:117 start_codon:yes stop_codon:yes gene_type:complete